MPKSKNSSKKNNHNERLAKYKANKKKEQDLFKKKMIDNYMKMQQQAVADKESHTSTQEVSGPDINIDDLNQIEDWEPISDVPVISEGVIESVEPMIDIDVEPVIDSEKNEQYEKLAFDSMLMEDVIDFNDIESIVDDEVKPNISE